MRVHVGLAVRERYVAGRGVRSVSKCLGGSLQTVHREVYYRCSGVHVAERRLLFHYIVKIVLINLLLNPTMPRHDARAGGIINQRLKSMRF